LDGRWEWRLDERGELNYRRLTRSKIVFVRRYKMLLEEER
jgi:hypothetical protein